MKAFPTNVKKSSGGDGWQTDYGMDLRDYFASHAMQALISLPDIDMSHEAYAELAYKIAGAMMKARVA
jgi:hypothetical protein